MKARTPGGGRVVKIRINPDDCMSVIDVIAQTGLLPKGASFAQVVTTALATLLEGVRRAKIIPTRDGFEYAAMMAEYQDQPHIDRARKLDITQAVALGRLHGAMPAVSIAEAPEKARQRVRFDELYFKRKNNSENWTEADQAEFMPLYDEFAPR